MTMKLMTDDDKKKKIVDDHHHTSRQWDFKGCVLNLALSACLASVWVFRCALASAACLQTEVRSDGRELQL